jgi:hypothetical protein
MVSMAEKLQRLDLAVAYSMNQALGYLLSQMPIYVIWILATELLIPNEYTVRVAFFAGNICYGLMNHYIFKTCQFDY